MRSPASVPPPAQNPMKGVRHEQDPVCSAVDIHNPVGASESRARLTPTGRFAVLLAGLALLAPGLFALESFQAAPASAEVTDEQLSQGGVLQTPPPFASPRGWI